MKVKVTMPKNYKDFYTVSDAETAKLLMKTMKDSETFITEFECESLINHVCRNRLDNKDYFKEVLKAEAETAKNNRIDWDYHGTETRNFDIWLTVTAETSNGFLKVGAYLSDIWSFDGEYDFTPHMYIRYYKEA